MRIGEFNTRITLKERAVSTDAGGFQTATMNTIATVWAKWVNVHGSEVWAAQTVKAIEPATVTIRYRSDVDETCAVVKDDVTYEIVSMDNIRERNKYIEMKVRRMASG